MNCYPSGPDSGSDSLDVLDLELIIWFHERVGSNASYLGILDAILAGRVLDVYLTILSYVLRLFNGFVCRFRS